MPMHSKVAPLLALLLAVGCINAVPFYPDQFDAGADFVPLEEQRPRNDHAREHERQKPFEVDVVTSDVNDDGPQSSGPGAFFQQSFPFFGQDFFNSFGGFGIGAGPQQEPWWKGPNVCTEKEEEEKEMDIKKEKDKDTKKEMDKDTKKENDKEPEAADTETAAATENIDIRPPLLGQFHFSVNSCIEKPNKYVCTRIANKNGKKKTLTITRQCCHGYGRPRNADYTTPCEKIEIKSLEETAADMGAKKFIASAKSSGDLGDMLTARKNQTIFMPNDQAYASYKEERQSETNLVESKADDRNLYLRHIVDGEISLDDVTNEQLLKTRQEGQTIRINMYQMPQDLRGEPFRYTANCVPIEKHDKMSEQGMVHTLDGVLKPVTRSVMDIIRQRRDMSIMRTVLEKTKLSEMLEGDKPVSIFVPTDDAFDKLEPNLRRALKEGKGCASNILKNHILDLTFCSVASVHGARTTAYNLLGEAMRFNRSKDAASSASSANSEKSEVADLLGEQPVFINGIAKIIEADLMGTNGVVHVIDAILPTKSALPMSTLMQEKNITIFKRLLEAAGMHEKFDDMNNVTIFAPTDKAMQGSKWEKLLAESPENLNYNEELLQLLNYHVVSPMIKTCDLTEKLLPTALDGSKVRVNLYSSHSLFSNVMNRATVNCARLVHFDDESCGSVLHQVDKVLTPPKMNLLELLQSNPNYSRFSALVRSANLSDLLANLEEGYTLLVPKNDVFEEVEDWEKTLTKDQNELENLVKMHIINDVVCCAGIIPTNWPFVRSIESLNGVHLRITRDRRPKIENAGVTKCDAVALNGIIHEINDVIVPPARHQQRPEQPAFAHGDHFGDIFF